MRRGYAIKMGGDMEIAGALADGIARAQRPRRAESPEEAEARMRAKAWIDSVKLHGERDAKYWSDLTFEAEMAYGEPLEPPTLFERLRERIAVGWAMAWLIILIALGREY